MELRRNEVNLHDNPIFQAYQTTTNTSYLEVATIETHQRSKLTGDVGEPMFELALELAPLKIIHDRAATSFLFMGGICAAVALFVYSIMNVLFSTC